MLKEVIYISFRILKPILLYIFSLYGFTKILNIKKVNKTKRIAMILILIVFVLLTNLFYNYFQYHAQIYVIIYIVLMIIINYIFFRKGIKISITGTIISFGISIFTYTLAGMLLSFIYAFLDMVLSEGVISTILLSVIHGALTVLFFKIKRIKNGFPFLINNKIPIIDVFLSALIIAAYLILTLSIKSNVLIISMLSGIVVVFVVLFILWKRQITNLYIKRQKEKELNYLYNTIAENKKLIDKLWSDNERLSKVIHKDNKLIPSIENAVLAMSDGDPRSEEILKQLRELFTDRADIIKDYQRGRKYNIQQTGYFLIDSMGEYMYKKAVEQKVDYSFEVSCSMDFIKDGIISEKDFCTVLADIIENALIAVKKMEYKAVSIKITEYNNSPAIIVSDSGEMFKAEVLSYLGLRRTTTHSHEGGSGIGLMSLYDIKGKAKASLIIREFLFTEKSFTKEIIFTFDNLNKYIIETFRSNELIEINFRDNIEIVDISNNYLG
mgnify:CR=1 FL=1